MLTLSSTDVSIPAFAFLVVISVGIASFAVGIKICAKFAAIRKYKLITKIKKKKHDKIVLLLKTNLNTVEVLTSKTLIDSYIRHGEFVLVNNVLKEYDDMKEKWKFLTTNKYVLYNKRNINFKI